MTDFLDRVVSAQKMYGRRIGLSRAWNGPFPYVLISKASAAEVSDPIGKDARNKFEAKIKSVRKELKNVQHESSKLRR